MSKKCQKETSSDLDGFVIVERLVKFQTASPKSAAKLVSYSRSTR